MLTDPKKILLVSNEPWGDLWFSKHHYANELSLLGHMVYFLNPPGSWSLFNLFDWKVNLKKENQSLTIVSTKNPFPVRILPRIATRFNDYFIFRRLKLYLNLKEDFVLWQFDYLRFIFNSNKLSIKRIYHVADPYMTDWRDGIVSSKANLIVCTSPKYVRHYKEMYKNKPVIHVPHGISPEEIKVDRKVLKSIENQYGDYILLVGTINEDVDLNLLNELIQHHKVLVIGKVVLTLSESIKKWERLILSDNLHFVGLIHAKELKSYVRGATICVLTYKFSLSKAIGTGSPLKVLNYIAQYKPVVSSIDPEIPSLLEQGIYWAKNQKQYLNLIDQGMKGNLQVNEKKIQHYLDKHYYPSLIDRILEELF